MSSFNSTSTYYTVRHKNGVEMYSCMKKTRCIHRFQENDCFKVDTDYGRILYNDFVHVIEPMEGYVQVRQGDQLFCKPSRRARINVSTTIDSPEVQSSNKIKTKKVSTTPSNKRKANESIETTLKRPKKAKIARAKSTIVFGHRQANDYFNAKKMSATVSNKTLNVANLKKLQRVWQAISCPQATAATHSSILMDSYEKRYSLWRNELEVGFNLLFSGFGSKMKLLQHFTHDSLSNHRIFTVHGYLKTFAMKKLIALMYSKLGKANKRSGSSILHSCRELAHIMNKDSDNSIVLLVHSIDGMSLRNPEIQQGLSILSRSKGIHLIASIDHINAVSLWPTSVQANFNFLRHDTPTYAPYDLEVPLLLPVKGVSLERSVEGIERILYALTPLQLKVIRIIAQSQLQAAGTNAFSGIKYHELTEICQTQLYLSGSNFLQTILNELKSHTLVKSKMVQSLEYIFIPLPHHIIRQGILNWNPQQKENTPT